MLEHLISPRRPRFGEEQKRVLLRELSKGELLSAPASIGTLISGGGFLIYDPLTATALSNAGFSINEHDLAVAEMDFLKKFDPTTYAAWGQPTTVVFATCPFGATLQDGKAICARSIPGLQEVAPREGTNPCNVDSAPEQSGITTAQLQGVKNTAPAGSSVCFRYFGSDVKPMPEDVRNAMSFVKLYDEVERKTTQSEEYFKQTGRTPTNQQVLAISNARVFLTKYKQPVEDVRKEYGGVSLGGTPRRASRTARFGVAWLVPVLVVIAIVAVSIAASVILCASEETRRKAIDADMALNEAMQANVDEMVKCINDPNRTSEERDRCARGLDSLADYRKNADPSNQNPPTDWAGLAKWGVIGISVAAGAYLLGPAIKAASVSAAARFDIDAQRKRQELSHIKKQSEQPRQLTLAQRGAANRRGR
jgi:hypothetical protein